MKEIFHRISVRKFEEREVEPEKIERILRAAMAAPSARNQQPWEFYVVTDREKILALSKMSKFSGCAAGAPAVIVSVYRKDILRPEYAHIDMSIAQENMWLETDSLGLGGVWLGTAPLEERMKMVEETLQLPDTVRAFAVFALGYPAETRPQQDRFDESRIHYVK